MENIIKRWDKISSKGKKHHMYLGASLYRNVPLVIFLIIAMELVNKYRYENINYLAINFVAKILVAYIIGVYIGHLEWNFLEKLVGNKFQTNKTLRKSYIYTYGICMFGTSIMIANIDPFFMSTRRILIAGFIYMLSGLLWGGLMSSTINKDFVK